MTTRPSSEQPDWLIPAVLVAVGAVVMVILIMLLVATTTSSDEDGLAGQMERWTTCLRSEGAPVPLVEPVGDNGFTVTVDDVVLEGSFDHDLLIVAFDLCLEHAPEAVQTIAAAGDGLSKIAFGVGDIGWLGPLLFNLDDSGLFDSSEMGVSPLGDHTIHELCAQLSELQFLVPEVALGLSEICAAMSDV